MKVYQMKTVMIAVQMIVILSHWNGLRQFYCKLLLGTIYISNFLAIHQQHVLNVATSHSRVWHKGDKLQTQTERWQTHEDHLDSVLRLWNFEQIYCPW